MDIILILIGSAFAIWFITTKQFRRDVGSTVSGSLVEAGKLSQQSLKIARATSYKEAKEEVGADISKLLAEADELLK